MLPYYSPGAIRALLETDLVTPATQKALQARLNDVFEAPKFFNTEAFETLRAACARLIPQPDRPQPIDIAAAIDARLADGKSDGWRYANMPPDGEAYPLGLQGLDETARARFGINFAVLDGPRQDEILSAVQRGEVTGDVWQTLAARRFFEELLAEAVECYYSHPLAQEEIGYVGFADAHGWQHIGLNEREPHEPTESNG
jgi:gluconate 2-dehydrogenase gamma chain